MTWPLWRPGWGQDGVRERIVSAIGYNFEVRLSNFHRDLKVYVGVALDVICLQWQALVFKGAFQVTKYLLDIALLLDKIDSYSNALCYAINSRGYLRTQCLLKR